MKYNYSDAIIKLRVKLNVSQTELSKILGVSFSSINRWEKGKFSPTVLAKEKLKVLFKENNIELGEI
ncbi:helix-turn-helix domain-containing protein [Mycoplasmopsis gallinarum]|uniref:helix-turn-helix domain-containing protein n=1 Tax=Mycoplasmopsis gallinarum TaxID=29557 RepID=UPI0004822F1D|nr:helix-turn-helix transcriptional regulator [Mycoplasmopsis gallinarum]